MKSKLFERFDPNDAKNDQFKRDARQLLTLTDAQRAACIEALPDFLLANTEAETRSLLEKLQAATECSAVVLQRIVSVLEFLSKAMRDDETRADTAPQWGEDLAELGVISRAELAAFVSAVESLGRGVRSVEAELERRRYATGVLPSLTSLGVTVELRAVQEHKYRWGTLLSEYKPQIVDVVPPVSIHVGTNVEEHGDLYFQANERELGLMIDTLTSARMDIEALRKAVSLSIGSSKVC